MGGRSRCSLWLLLAACADRAPEEPPPDNAPPAWRHPATAQPVVRVPDPPELPPPVLPDLSAIRVNPAVGDALLARCRARLLRGERPRTLPVAAADLDHDGHVEIVLFNQICTDDAGADVVHPVARYNPDADAVELVGALAWRQVDGAAVGRVTAATFVDMDADGDPDLVTDALATNSVFDVAHVWLNDGAGAFTPVLDQGATAMFSREAGFTLADLDDDGRMDIMALGGDPDAFQQTTRPIPVFNRLPAAMVADPDVGEARAGAVGWTIVTFSDEVLADPDRYTFSSPKVNGNPEDFVWRSRDGVNLPDDLIDLRRDPVSGAPLDAMWFVDPACGAGSPACVVPMGGGPLRVDWGGGAAQDCLSLSTGRGLAPLALFCFDAADGRFYEAAGKAAVFHLAEATAPLQGLTLAWYPTDRWDFNADGARDVLITNGRDSGPFPVMPQFGYLGDPTCADGACPPFRFVELPIPRGHFHGLGWFLVRRADGSHKVLAWLSSNAEAEEADARIGLFTWETDRPWTALQLGPADRLDAIGAIVHGVFVDARGAQVGPAWTRVNALTSTWGYPGANPPILTGVPDGATALRVDVTLPGCRPAVQVEVTRFGEPVDVPIPACPE